MAQKNNFRNKIVPTLLFTTLLAVGCRGGPGDPLPTPKSADQTAPLSVDMTLEGGTEYLAGQFYFGITHKADDSSNSVVEKVSGMNSITLYASPFKNLSIDQVTNSNNAKELASLSPAGDEVTEYMTLNVPTTAGDWHFYGHNAQWTIYALSKDNSGNQTLDEITGISGGPVMNGHVLSGNISGYNSGSMEVYDEMGNIFNDGSDFGIISGDFGFNLMNGVTGVDYKLAPTGSSKEQNITYNNGGIDLNLDF